MTCFLTHVLATLMMCVLSSKGELSPPKNLTVSLLDFTVTTEWLPGEGNPPGSRYSLEFSDLNQVSQGKWTKSPDYTDIDTLKCNWSFGQPDDHFRSYFVRVRSIYKEMKSNWTTLPKSFQPYEDTRLSPPEVTISTKQMSIKIFFSHRLESSIKLTYMVFLFENSPTGEIKFVGLISTSNSPHEFFNVSPAKNYCVNVSASHQMASRNKNFNTTKCIFVSESSRSFHLVFIVALLLITFFAGIVLAFICLNYIRPNINNLHVPSALNNVSKTYRVLKVIPEGFHSIYQTQTWQKTEMNKDDHDSSSDEDSGDFYLPRVVLTHVIVSITSTNPPQDAEEPVSNHAYKYALATDLEELNESGSAENVDELRETPESYFANRSESCETLQTIAIDSYANSEMGRSCEEQTSSGSSGNEEELSAEEK